MAANSNARAIAGSFGKRFVNQICSGRFARDPAPAISVASRNAASYSSASYEKEIDDQIRPSIVPDHVIHSSKGDGKYWGPNPNTGVFGPSDEKGGGGSSSSNRSRPTTPQGGGDSSVLDQTAWFRPLEDVDKPPYA